MCVHDKASLSDVFAEYAQDQSDLGAALNGFSLNENGELSGAIEKTGQAVDVSYISTTKLVCIMLYYLGSCCKTCDFPSSSRNSNRTGLNPSTNTVNSRLSSRSCLRIAIRSMCNMK